MRLVVFDMDGTLIDTHAVIAEHMAAAFLAIGLPVPPASEMRRVIGLSLPVAVGQLTQSDDVALIEQLGTRYKDLYRAAVEVDFEREPLYPGALEALKRLNAQPETVLGIATGKELPGVHRILGNHAILQYFTTLQTPDHNPSKPDPGMMLSAMRETGTDAAQAVMVGDTVFDMQMGKAAGAKAIGVSWGYHDVADLRAAGADVIIDRYGELLPAIDRLMG